MANDRQARRVARALLAQRFEAAIHDASLGVGHIWTAVQCPAYNTLNPADCTCGGAEPRSV